MSIAITSGKIQRPVRALVYGPEGIGKSTFGSKFPKPLFIDAEDGTAQLDVDRTPKPTSWQMVKAIAEDLTRDCQGYKTLVIDTADWLEKLCVAEILAKHNAQSLVLVAGGFGKGFIILAEEWKKFLDELSLLQERQGMNIVFLAHSKIRHANIPTETGEFDRYEVRMEEKSCAPLREWVDLHAFVNYKTYLETDKNGNARAAGGKERVMHVAHNACWDAKNRYGLPDELPFDFAKIAHIFNAAAPVAAPAKPAAPAGDAPKDTPPAETPKPARMDKPGPLPECLPKALRDLMISELTAVTVDELMESIKTNFKLGTPVENVPLDFWTEKVVPNWKTRIIPRIEAYRKTPKAA